MHRSNADRFPLVIYDPDSGNDAFLHHSHVIPGLSSKPRQCHSHRSESSHPTPYYVIGVEHRVLALLEVGSESVIVDEAAVS